MAHNNAAPGMVAPGRQQAFTGRTTEKHAWLTGKRHTEERRAMRQNRQEGRSKYWSESHDWGSCRHIKTRSQPAHWQITCQRPEERSEYTSRPLLTAT